MTSAFLEHSDIDRRRQLFYHRCSPWNEDGFTSKIREFQEVINLKPRSYKLRKLTEPVRTRSGVRSTSTGLDRHSGSRSRIGPVQIELLSCPFTGASVSSERLRNGICRLIGLRVCLQLGELVLCDVRAQPLLCISIFSMQRFWCALERWPRTSKKAMPEGILSNSSVN